MSTSTIGSISSLSGSSSLSQFDPAKMMADLVKRFLNKNDKDGDGMLSSQELSGLSADAFKALDTNGDGKLGSDEIKAAMQKAMDEMKQVMTGSDPQQAANVLKDTPEGQLMQLMRPDKEDKAGGQGGAAKAAGATQGSGTKSSEIVSVAGTGNAVTITYADGHTATKSIQGGVKSAHIAGENVIIALNDGGTVTWNPSKGTTQTSY